MYPHCRLPVTGKLPEGRGFSAPVRLPISPCSEHNDSHESSGKTNDVDGRIRRLHRRPGADERKLATLVVVVGGIIAIALYALGLFLLLVTIDLRSPVRVDELAQRGERFPQA
ncbi:hypothetical protein BJ988_004888 [Nocardioides panzhihuensis]|uniref:Uncharacterized protein n=1 Tax=Nocardioides panzhihuensis TaxID=860243 RepID=A0A7Z0IUR3_9ACTN|nr:hypothetical protein [Nocardioides panzhihuensis]